MLDAVEGPSEPPSNAVALAAWFASTFEAEEMIVIGAELPDNPGVPLRAHAEEQHTL